MTCFDFRFHLIWSSTFSFTLIVNIYDSFSFIDLSTFPFTLFVYLLSLSFSLYLIVCFQFHFSLAIVIYIIYTTASPFFDDPYIHFHFRPIWSITFTVTLFECLFSLSLVFDHNQYRGQFLFNLIAFFPFHLIWLSTFTLTLVNCLLSLSFFFG